MPVQNYGSSILYILKLFFQARDAVGRAVSQPVRPDRCRSRSLWPEARPRRPQCPVISPAGVTLPTGAARWPPQARPNHLMDRWASTPRSDLDFISISFHNFGKEDT
ncbi:hypothetical protein RRG08_014776 [Elysia crispata]|uniref:Uncharacterized protein n=1 Tax=Elysia crispata TaxID=231223 RepID=A0AAE1AWT4_9GAST|nr:hypothetical protein RRG08_014776 [Elysia crispata]